MHYKLQKMTGIRARHQQKAYNFKWGKKRVSALISGRSAPCPTLIYGTSTYAYIRGNMVYSTGYATVIKRKVYRNIVRKNIYL